MEIAVSGATGFVGREVCRALSAAGLQPRILARTRRARGHHTTPGSHMATDFASVSQIADRLDGTAAVIHLAGIIGEIGNQTFEEVHVDLTTRMIEAARRAGVRRFVHMSALGTRPDALARYHRSKWEGECRIRGSGLDWTIFRPSVIHGAGDSFTNLFARMANLSPVLPLFGGGESLLQPIGVENVAKSLASATADDSTSGETFDLCGPTRLSLRALVELILAIRGQRRWLLSIPWPLARLQATLLERLCPALLGRAAPLTRDQLLMLREDNIGEGGPADQRFHLEHRPLAQDLARWLAP